MKNISDVTQKKSNFFLTAFNIIFDMINVCSVNYVYIDKESNQENKNQESRYLITDKDDELVRFVTYISSSHAFFSFEIKGKKICYGLYPDVESLSRRSNCFLSLISVIIGIIRLPLFAPGEVVIEEENIIDDLSLHKKEYLVSNEKAQEVIQEINEIIQGKRERHYMLLDNCVDFVQEIYRKFGLEGYFSDHDIRGIATLYAYTKSCKTSFVRYIDDSISEPYMRTSNKYNL